MLGGVRIEHDRGLKAHSDGDVILHALCDALLGALALGDIGRHFPDTDNQYANVDSRELLRCVYALVTERGYRLQNADITVLAQRPKLAPHILSMRENIAADLNVDSDCISVKATTTEKLGFVGREEGISAHAVVLLSK
jgi:2-C-methyl-D-erythritol 2,4-cyclodiphosphate synthase